MHPRLLLNIAIFFAVAADGARADAAAGVRRLQTPDGVEFGLVGERPAKPAATLFVVALDVDRTLTDPSFNRVGMILGGQGYLCVALDAPCHGKDNREKLDNALAGWRERITRGEDLVGDFTSRCSEVLDHLVRDGYTDPSRVAVAGTSRGGFLALHWAASESRVGAVAAFAPVTDLAALSEFNGAAGDARVTALSLAADTSDAPRKLAGRPVWVWIGADDDRVGTGHAIAFARGVARASKAQGKAAAVELHVMPSPGHSVGPAAHPAAATWIAAQLSAAHAAASQITEDVGDRACLFLDDRFIAEQSGFARTFHQGRPLPEPAIVADPWDQWPHLFGSVIFDPREKVYRMWYSSIREGIFYAESSDGRKWSKPKLRLHDADGSKDNNYVMPRVSLPNVLLDDARDADPAARFKLFAWDHSFYNKEPKEDRHNGHTLFRSSDGIHWDRVGQGIPGSNMAPEDRCTNFVTPDTNQVIWDGLRGRYLASFRTYPKRWAHGEFDVGRRRSIGITSAPKITGPWEPIVTRVVADEEDDKAAAAAMRGVDATAAKWAELYSMPMFTWGNHYIGLLSLIHVARSPGAAPVANAAGGGALQLTFSHDGVTWHRPSPRKPLVAPSDAKDLHPTYAACSPPLVMGEEIWIYYSEQNSSHPTTEDPRSQIRAAAWRKDGFASLDAAGGNAATLTTVPVRVSGDRLVLNYKASPGGSVRVGLLSADGSELPGFEQASCDAVLGDATAAVITWRGKSALGTARSDVVRLRITAVNATLFAFRFER